MTDRELLELAAKAAGLEFDPTAKTAHGLMVVRDGAVCQSDQVLWNPLSDDGDALRLAVKLNISVVPYPIYSPIKHAVIVKQRRRSDTLREPNPTEITELHGDDPCAATRRAIVRAAAEIGKGLE
jgi:hypothetical protein